MKCHDTGRDPGDSSQKVVECIYHGELYLMRPVLSFGTSENIKLIYTASKDGSKIDFKKTKLKISGVLSQALGSAQIEVCMKYYLSNLSPVSLLYKTLDPKDMYSEPCQIFKAEIFAKMAFSR